MREAVLPSLASPLMPTKSWLIDVVEVTPSELPSSGGRPWTELIAEAASDESSLVLRTVEYGGVNQVQEARTNWLGPADKDGRPYPFLPINKAWLREIDGRAFLYRQNW